MCIRFVIHISAFDGGRDHETAQTSMAALSWTNGLDVVRTWGDNETGSLDPSYLGSWQDILGDRDRGFALWGAWSSLR